MIRWITFIFICLTFKTYSQVSESPKVMSLGTNNALTIPLSGISSDDTEKLWKKYIDQYDGSIKWNKKAKEYFVDNASIPSVSESTVDLYAKAEGVGSDVNFSVWIDMGGAFLTSITQPEKFSAASEILSGFYREVEKFKTEQKWEAEEKKLKSLSSDMKDIIRDRESDEKDIKKAEAKIAELKAKIMENLKTQATKQSEIDAQQIVVDGVKATLGKME